MYLTDGQDKARDRATSRERLSPLIAQVSRRGRAAGRTRQIIFRDAQYTFAQLAAWRDRMLEPALEIKEVVFLDADEAVNRVTVGLRNAGAQGRVEAILDQLDIPRGAANYTQAGMYVTSCDPEAIICDEDPCSIDPSSPECQVQTDTADISPSTATPTPSIMPESGTELWSHHPRLQGGIGITRFIGYDQFGNIGNQLCSGFPARWNGRDVFITNSHCTERFFGSDTSVIWQPVVADPGNSSHPWVIGKEVYDPDLRCGSGWLSRFFRCRRADAAVIAVDGRRPLDLGLVARTEHHNYGGRTGGKGSTKISTLQQSFQIIGNRDPAAGQEVDKVGPRTGWTWGEVTRTCIDARLSFRNTLRCQTHATFFGEEGDSGSPVLLWGFHGYGTQVSLGGIYWGDYTDPNTGVVEAVFSPMSWVGAEMGGGLQTHP